MAVQQMTCVHKWQIDRQNVGTCSACGEVRQFPHEKGQEPVTLLPGAAPRRRGRPRRTDPPATAGQDPAPSRNGHLPHFPDFSGTWDPSVQLKWLGVYQKLHTKEKNNEH